MTAPKAKAAKKSKPGTEVVVKDEQTEAKAQFSYDANTGVFKRRSTGCVATSRHNAGYLTLRFLGRNVLAHRLAWLYVHGRWPAQQIDHINGNRADNSILNLRECTNAQNCQNVRPHRDGCGLLGASLDKRWNRWQAGIGINGKRVHLGYFSSAQEAHQAYLDAKRDLHAFGGSNV